ncbi:MAG: thiamine diphosphokinase [Actinobacteria bacterium]|nr:thiamine diphosphokinase [Actinomycetota bacterium]
MTAEIVLILAGGEATSPETSADLPRADLVVAADSGYDAAVELGLPVDVLVGDLDSIQSADIPDHVVVERHPPDKDATDLELALELVSREAPVRVVVVGGSGGRLDHELAVAALLCSDRWANIDEIDWRSERGWAYVVRRRRVLHGDAGATVTILAVGGDADGVTTRGLKWNLKEETLAPGSTRGVSNVMTGPVADIRVEGGVLLVIFPDPPG